MPFQMFYEIFPVLARKENRSVIVPEDNPILPPDEYGFLETYCNEDGCDCRRVLFNVASKNRNEYVAVIGYGWESADFYRQWTTQDDPEFVRAMQGPALNPLSPQSALAPALLDLTENFLLQDATYIDRLKRHYQIFKEKVDPKHFSPSGAKVGRIVEPVYEKLDKVTVAPSLKKKPRKRRH